MHFTIYHHYYNFEINVVLMRYCFISIMNYVYTPYVLYINKINIIY